MKKLTVSLVLTLALSVVALLAPIGASAADIWVNGTTTYAYSSGSRTLPDGYDQMSVTVYGPSTSMWQQKPGTARVEVSYSEVDHADWRSYGAWGSVELPLCAVDVKGGAFQSAEVKDLVVPLSGDAFAEGQGEAVLDLVWTGYGDVQQDVVHETWPWSPGTLVMTDVIRSRAASVAGFVQLSEHDAYMADAFTYTMFLMGNGARVIVGQ